MSRSPSDVWRLAAGLASLAAVTWVYAGWLHVSNAAIVSTTFLLIVLVVAASSRLWMAVVTSVVAMGFFNFFFLPPVGTLTIADPQNWAALFGLLTVSLLASHLSAVARTRTNEALGRRDELARLFDLSRDVLVMPEGRDAIAMLAQSVSRRFDFDFVAIALPRPSGWDVFEGGGDRVALDADELAKAFAVAQSPTPREAGTLGEAGHAVIPIGGREVRLVPLRIGAKPTGILAAAGRSVESGTLDALGGVVAIAIERARFLAERKEGELARQREALQTALLASLRHDLQTPLTAIRVAAGNIVSSGLGPADRHEQGELILAEVERLTRLFQNVHAMARIDAGSIAAEARWVHPSEIVAATRDQVEQMLRDHEVEVRIELDVPVHLDPRLTAAAAAHVLENAAQYSPPGSTIRIDAHVTDTGLTIQVRDEGPGIAEADLPHLFDRFYRGAEATSRASGTGMGLWIARGLLAAQDGRVEAENGADRGARFTLFVPARVKAGDMVASGTE